MSDFETVVLFVGALVLLAALYVGVCALIAACAHVLLDEHRK